MNMNDTRIVFSLSRRGVYEGLTSHAHPLPRPLDRYGPHWLHREVRFESPFLTLLNLSRTRNDEMSPLSAECFTFPHSHFVYIPLDTTPRVLTFPNGQPIVANTTNYGIIRPRGQGTWIILRYAMVSLPPELNGVAHQELRGISTSPLRFDRDGRLDTYFNPNDDSPKEYPEFSLMTLPEPTDLYIMSGFSAGRGVIKIPDT